MATSNRGLANTLILRAPNGDTLEYKGELLACDEKCLQAAEDGVGPMIVYVLFRVHGKRSDCPSNARVDE